jgi:hypothetical protein
MRYQVGNIGIQIHPSTPYWTSQVRWAMNRQLGGFQVHTESDATMPYRINFLDYARLPIAQNDSYAVVPGYCYYSAGLYVDTQQGIALEIDKQVLNVWCSAGFHGISIPFLLQAMLLMQGKSLVHAAAIDVHGSGILLAAFGGIGKTSFIAHASRKTDVKVLGDDMIIVTNQGMLEPYLRPFAMYEYHKSLFPDFFAENRIEYKPLTLSWRVYNKVRGMLAKKLGHTWHQPERVVRTGYVPVAPERVLPISVLATRPVKLDHIYLVQRSGVSSTTNLQVLDPEQAVCFMLDVIYHEWYSQLRLLLSWLAHRAVSIAEYLAQVEAILHAAVSNSQSVNLITIPLHMTSDQVAEELVRRVIQ